MFVRSVPQYTVRTADKILLCGCFRRFYVSIILVCDRVLLLSRVDMSYPTHKAGDID